MQHLSENRFKSCQDFPLIFTQRCRSANREKARFWWKNRTQFLNALENGEDKALVEAVRLVQARRKVSEVDNSDIIVALDDGASGDVPCASRSVVNDRENVEAAVVENEENCDDDKGDVESDKGQAEEKWTLVR